MTNGYGAGICDIKGDALGYASDRSAAAAVPTALVDHGAHVMREVVFGNLPRDFGSPSDASMMDW